MKKYRPYNSGYIVLYVLVALCASDALFTLIGQMRGTLNEYMRSFALFSYLIAAMAIAYAYVYVRTVVCIDGDRLRIAFPANIQPPEGAKRAMIVYRQGPNDLKLIDKTIDMKKIERYGYVDDLGFSRVDKSTSTEKSPLFPVKEVCFLTSDGKRYHMNAAIYKPKQLKAMFTQIREATGIEPEGSLAEVLK